MIRFYVVPRADILALLALNGNQRPMLDKYERVRPDVLHDRTQDIFSPNSRSERHPTDFSLFQQVDSPSEADVVVCQAWLEVAHHCRAADKVQPIIDAVVGMYRKPIVFSWNHDIDAAKHPALQNLPERVVVLNYNTSKPTPNDLLLPFWNVDPKPPTRPKQYFAGFRGTMCGPRSALYSSIYGKSGYYCSTLKTDEAEYLMLLSSFWFSLCPRGGGLSSYRFYESIHCGSIPVLFGDDAALPYPDLDWDAFSVRIPEKDASDFVSLHLKLKTLDKLAMTAELPKVAERFTLLGVQREVHNRLREVAG